MAEKRSILCFGDSLTWGWIPVKESAPTLRYPYEQRWTGAMAAKLGDGYRIIEEGLSARTTSLDDPNDPRLNGSAYLPAALASHLPLDLVIIMLGTNDTKSYFHRTPYEIANGMGKLVSQVLTSAGGVGTSYLAPKVLVVAPRRSRRCPIRGLRACSAAATRSRSNLPASTRHLPSLRRSSSSPPATTWPPTASTASTFPPKPT